MSLSAALHTAGNALAAFEKALTVVQNNVTNSSTPGYVRQTPTFEAAAFGYGSGEPGGVLTGPVQSARDQYAEQTVRIANSQLGMYEQQVQTLTDLQNQFDISGNSGVPGALSGLYNAFSTWANSPNDPNAKQGVMTAADTLARSFQQTVANVSQAASNASTQVDSLVAQVNTITGNIAAFNAKLKQGDHNDPGIDASINSSLQDLSEIANVTVTNHSDGSVDVMLDGQIDLVSGIYARPINVGSSPLTPTASVTGGNPVGTVNITAGKNDTLQLKIDGATNKTITLSPNDTTLSAVVTDMNSQLGGLAKASTDSQGRLVITSANTGANAAVQVLAANANSTVGLITTGNPGVVIQDSAGNDITDKFTQGKLGGALAALNQLFPAIQGSNAETGSLNQLAGTLADRVNSLLGVDLFTYNRTSSAGVAGSMQLNSKITASSMPSPHATSVTGTAVTQPLDLTTNNQLNLTVDGATYPPVTLSPTDTTILDVVADLNAKFASLGIGAYATVNGNTGALIISTTGTGNNASVQINAGTANTTLGLNSATPTYGNVATVTGAPVVNPVSITANSTDELDLQVNGTKYPIMLSSADTTLAVVADDLNQKLAALGLKAGATLSPAGALVISATGTGTTSLQVLSSGTANSQIGMTSPTTTSSQSVNAIALNLANLETPQTSADEINGQSYSSYFGSIASSVGSVLATATTGQTSQQDVLNQAESIRQQISGVDLNFEATQVIQLQSSYNAASKLVTVIDDMTQTVLGLITKSSVL